MLLVVGCWLLVVGCWLLVVGCWLLVVGCWLLVVGCWLSSAVLAILIREFSGRSVGKPKNKKPDPVSPEIRK
jgi:membrane protein implicated in regulation of membrane protease activity